MEYQLKWTNLEDFSWFARRIRSSGGIYGTVSCLTAGIHASFQGTLSPEETKRFFEIASRFKLPATELEFLAPVNGILAILDPRKILAIFPTALEEEDRNFKKLAALVEPEIKRALKSAIGKDEQTAKAWGRFIEC